MRVSENEFDREFTNRGHTPESGVAQKIIFSYSLEIIIVPE
jgi:hypothetical protein